MATAPLIGFDPPVWLDERATSPRKYVEFGYSHDDAVAAVLEDLDSGDGVIDLRGYDWTFTEPWVIPGGTSHLKILADGGSIAFSAAVDGACIQIGDGVTQCENITIDGGYWTANSNNANPLILTRKVRILRTTNMTVGTCWQFHKWGDADDGTGGACYYWFIDKCAITINTGTASHGIRIGNSAGALYWGVNDMEGGDNAGTVGIYVEPGNPQSLDHVELMGGIIKGFPVSFDCPSRMLNFEMHPNMRFDDFTSCGFRSIPIAGNGATGGLSHCRINGTFTGLGGIAVANAILIEARGTFVQNAISIDITHFSQTTTGTNEESIKLVTENTATFTQCRLKAEIRNWKPDANTRRAVLLDENGGTMDVFVGPINVTLATGATTPNYLVENATSASSNVNIRGPITGPFVTGALLDTQAPGNTVSRYTAVEADGFPRNSIHVTLTNDGTIVIPKNRYIKAIYMRNSTANAVTGGIKIGTTSGGTDVVAAQAVGANAFLKVADADVLIKGWSSDQTLFIQDVTAWNSASVTVTFETVLL